MIAQVLMAGAWRSGGAPPAPRAISAALSLRMGVGRQRSILVVGGTGRIGTAVAGHILGKEAGGGGVRVVLAGRCATKGAAALAEVAGLAGGEQALRARGHALEFTALDLTDSGALERALSSGCRDAGDAFDACVHTAGPFFDGPNVLRSCIAAGTPVYVDVADPVPYLTEALECSAAAERAGTLALVAGGAFPGYDAAHTPPPPAPLASHFPCVPACLPLPSLIPAGLPGCQTCWRWRRPPSSRRVKASATSPSTTSPPALAAPAT